MNDVSKVVWKPYKNFAIESEHKCDRFPSRFINYAYENFVIVNDKGKWFWITDTYADPKTVDDGEASCVGVYLIGYGFEILFCPYCGQRLTE